MIVRSLVNGLGYCLAGLMCLSIAFLLYDYTKMIRRIEQLESLQKPLFTKSEAEVVTQSEHAKSEPMSYEPWAHVQLNTKDTVVQVFSQVAELDINQPYKIASQGQSFGSGFFINEEGELITNAHVVVNAQSVWIQIPSLGKKIIDVDIVGICPDRDLALLRLTPESYKLINESLGKIPFLALGDSDKVFRSDEVMALGYPLAQHSLKSTTGVVSGREHITTQHFIQISAPINPGSSGGPSINHKGQAIGVNTAVIQGAQNVGYIIPINELKIILDDLRKVKLLRKPFLGLVYLATSESLVKYLGNPEPGGCYVIEIYKHGLLEKAGVKPEDMIYEIDGHAVDLYGEMNVPWSEDKVTISDYVSRLSLGQKITMTLYRKGVKKNISLSFELPKPLPIRLVYPNLETIDYEIIGGMVVTQLSLNHVATMLPIAPELARYTETKNQQEPALVVTHIFPDSQVSRSRTLTIGSILSEINGKEIKTLDELRTVLKENVDKEFMTLKSTNNVFIAMPFKKLVSEEKQLSRVYHYPMTSLAHEFTKIIDEQGEKRT